VYDYSDSFLFLFIHSNSIPFTCMYSLSFGNTFDIAHTGRLILIIVTEETIPNFLVDIRLYPSLKPHADCQSLRDVFHTNASVPARSSNNQLQSSSSSASIFGFFGDSTSSSSSATSSAALFFEPLPPLPPFLVLPGVTPPLSSSPSSVAVSPPFFPPLKAPAIFLNLAMRWVTAFGVQSVRSDQ
jgi:hypothetical protein